MKDQVKEIISNHLGLEIDQIDDNADIFEVLGADSLDGVDLLLSMEDLFGLSVPDEEAIELRTVNKIVNYIEETK